MRFPSGVLLLALVSSLGGSPLVAQQVPTEPASTHIFPAGGRRGTTVPVRVGGEFLPPSTRFTLIGDGVTAPPELSEPARPRYEPSPRRKPGGTPINYPREWQSQIAISPDATPGQKLWRVASARGGAGARPFLVGDLPEFIETESNSSPESAEPVTLPITLNGQIAGERDVDYYRFTVAAGAVVTIDVAAARLGSPLDSLVEFRDSRGEKVPAVELRRGSDPVLAFRAAVAGEYRLSVANLNFRGGPAFVYRATLSSDEYVVAPFPPGGLSGTTSTMELLTLTGSPDLSGPRVVVDYPAGPPRECVYRSPVPTALPVTFETTDVPAITEHEPNDVVSEANEVLATSIVYGRLKDGTDADWYVLHAVAGQAITLECQVVPRGAGGWPQITVCDPRGQPLAKASTVELLPRPCRLEWRVPEDGRFLIQVRDVRQGGNETLYRLELRPTRPDFSLTALSDIVNVVQGNRGEIDFKIDRQGGLTGPIDLAVTGMPEGARLEPTQIPANVETFKVAVVAIDDIRPGDSRLEISGTAQLGSESFTRVATAIHQGHDLEGVAMGTPTVDHLQLTIRHKQVFRLFCSEAYQYAHRGTVYPYLMEVERMNGFDGPIEIEMGDRQIMDHDGVQVVNTTLPAGVSQFMLPLYLPETMHINIQPHSNIYAQGYVVFTDKWGQRQSMLQVSEMRCMIRPLPTVAKLRCREKTVTLRPGESQEIALQLERTTNFNGPMRVALQEPVAGLRMNPVEIDAGQSTATAVLTLEVGRQLEVDSIILRGEGVLDGGVKVVSSVELTVTGSGGPETRGGRIQPSIRRP